MFYDNTVAVKEEWDGSYQDKRRIMKMSHFQMIKELNEEWRNQTGY